MRPSSFVRAVAFSLTTVALIVACGSSSDSTFDPGSVDGGQPPPPPAGFGSAEAGTSDGGDTSCQKLTCADQNIECGPAGDGCGGLIPDCGKCGAGLRCGGPNAPSKCVSPSIGTGCVPKTCAELGVQCGPAGDGCGGLLSCGSCGIGEQCGADGKPSQCVAAVPTGPDGGACVQKTCADYLAENKDCGIQSDGCGGTINCGGCVDPEFCGGGGPSKCAVSGGGVCTPKTCADYPGKCGPQPNGCGGVTADCGTCTFPEVCGGGGVASVCGGGVVQGPGGGTCVPKTTADCGANQCGMIADGCGGVVDCGMNCTGGTICGGAGVANQCGAPACTPIAQATACAGKNCGTVADGCGGSYSCGGACTAPAICGGGGVPNVCGGGVVTGPGGGTCTPITMCPANSCGPIADGCGGVLPCGNCPSPQACGANGVPSQCGGGNQCVPLTQAVACGSKTCGYAADGCGGSYTCGTLAGACPPGQSCGLYAPDQCGSLTGPCITTGSNIACTNDSDCCSGFCGVNQRCQATACVSVGAACTTNAQCCTGVCTGGTCQSINGGTCLGSENTCTNNAECCSKLCTNGKCDSGSSFCRQKNDTCVSNDQCCSGRCSKPVGALAGTCQDLSISGVGQCVVAGTIAACDGLGPSGYACDQSCCSRSCGTSGATGGIAICQQPSGCAPLGELCQMDQDCCGFLNPAGLKCSKTSPTEKYGRCANGNSCSKPGEVCKTGSSSTACSVANNCCEPLNMPSGNCNSNPDACCRQDSLGIPRCIRDFVCAPAGEICITSADCCNQNPCIDDGTGTNTFRCAVNACVDDGGNCTTNEDCCGGNCYKSGPGDQTGVCRVPTCTPKTCADYPGKCGVLSDGCGGLTPNCGDCVYPQTCGGAGTPNVCGGTACTANTCAGLGAECGTVPDGCGNLLTCPPCPTGTTCGGGGEANKCGAPTCNTLTCSAQNIQCGMTGDGCGNVLTCDPCPAGTTCGGGGVPNQCGAPACTPLTVCPMGKNCGQWPDGCGGSINCGTCPDGQTCGGGGAPNVCGAASCTAKSCAQQGAECGTISDQCGDVVTCPPCGPDQFCNGQNLCVGLQCTAKTCVQMGVECGPTANGCGGLVDCGPCPPGQGCGAGGVPGKCGTLQCTPKTCAELGAVCGQVADGCGGLTPLCGNCTGNLSCKNGACVEACTPRTCAQAGANCGAIADGCGGIVDCGVCPDGFECGYGGTPNVCGQYQPK